MPRHWGNGFSGRKLNESKTMLEEELDITRSGPEMKRARETDGLTL